MQGYFGDDDEGEPILWDLDVVEVYMGDDDDGEPIVVEVP